MSHWLLVILFSAVFFKIYAQENCEKLKDLIEQSNFEQAYDLISHFDESQNTCYNLVGEVYFRKGRNDLAEKYFNRALVNAPPESEEKASNLNSLGLIYWNSGNNYKAIEYITEALDIREKVFTQKNKKVAASYNDLGLVSINPDIALENYEKALKIYQELQASDEKIAQIKTNMGIIYRNMEFFGDARNNFTEALNIWHRLYPQGHINEAFALLNLGQIHQKMGQMPEALQLYKKALVNYQKYYGARHPDIAYTYNLMGKIYNQKGEFDQALINYQKALMANSPVFSNKDIEYNPAVGHYFNANTMLSTLYLKAQAFEDLHYAFSRKFRDLKLSLSTLQSCDTLIDNIRQLRTNEKDKLELGTIAEQVYEGGVRLCYDMAGVSIKKQPYYELSFYYAEKSKSAVLLEAISDVAAKSYAGIPISKLDEEKRIKAEINFYEQKLATYPDEKETKKYRTALFDLKQQYNSFINNLEVNYPRYYNLKYNVQIPTISDLSSTLNESTALLSYFIADRFKRLYVFKITQNGLEIDNVSHTDDFNRYISGFRNSIYFKDDDIYKLTAVQLYNILFPCKLNKAINQLIIIPAGRLAAISFEALLTDKVKDNHLNYSSLHYLLNDYSISYQSSSALYFQHKKAGKNISTTKEALLCAPVKFNYLPDLPATQEEIKNLQIILADKKIRPKLFLQNEANEELVKSTNLANYLYIHLATHGYVNQSSPALSKIILSKTSDNDGDLFSGEIYNLNLNADLVTLSACETGLGKISQGEGIIGLSRAFAYAGANNMVVSLWSVADNSTSSLMTSFYKKITSNKFSQPLQQAKLEMIKDTNYARPYYWAPFILIGR